jgi:hypothetical protein
LSTFEQRIDRIIKQILVECSDVNPPLDHNEITRHVIEELREEMREVVPSALNRLVTQGYLRDNSDHGQGRPRRYWLAEEPPARKKRKVVKTMECA